MYTVYLDVNTPICNINEKTLKLKHIKNNRYEKDYLPTMETIIQQIIRGVNVKKVESLRCINLTTKQFMTLGSIVNQSNVVTDRRLSKDEKERIDFLREKDISEQLIADEVNISRRKLYRIYPRAFNASKHKP
jgi:AraC-like DNA-binding protein